MKQMTQVKQKNQDIFGNIKVEKITEYLRGITPRTLGIEVTDPIRILGLKPGAHNLNYHVRVNARDFIFRINIDQQSELPNQVEHEYNILKFLEGLNIAPKVYYMDDKKEFFGFAILIEEYLEGSHLELEKGEMKEVAELLGRLHSLQFEDTPFVIWNDPLVDTYNLARNDLMLYESKRTAENRTVQLARKLLARVETTLSANRAYYHPEGLNHTDVVCDNFIKTPKGLRLIDWEKPRVDDCTYDLCCFLSEPAQLWCTESVLNAAAQKTFLQAYARLKGDDLDFLNAKIRSREPMISLHWVLWGAIKLCDFRECSTTPELLKAHEEKLIRYERLAHPENIDKLIESVSSLSNNI